MVLGERGLQAGGSAFGGRLLIGLGQGAFLYALFWAADGKSWPADEPLLIAPLVLVGVFVPLIALIGWQAMRLRTLLLWSAVAAAALTAVALHDLTWRGESPPEPSERAFAAFFFSAVGLFIAQALVAAGDAERRFLARYPACFDAAWKLAVQAVLTLSFLGTFWVIVYLGTGLFALIGLTAFAKMIEQSWFWIPATTLAIAAALHITDVQPAIVRGIRTLKLTLLSWLLPLLAGIVLVFLASLPFTGLQPLWDTKLAAPILLGVEAGLVLLINATYQDGTAEAARPPVLRLAMPLGALALLPLVAISAYGLWLRVGQHGWTADRIFLAAAVALAALYALGYAWAVLRSGTAMRALEPTNMAAALVALALLLALFTPIADPARLAVASQMSRLASGAVPWAEFDLAHLRFDGGRYGKAALEKLKAAASDPAVIRRIEEAQAAQNRYSLAGKGGAAPQPPSEAAIRANITMHPAGQALPADFSPTAWGTEIDRLPCLSKAGVACEGFLIDLNGDGSQEILLTDTTTTGTIVFVRRGGAWVIGGYVDDIGSCAAALADLREGKGSTAPLPWAELSAGGYRFRVSPPMPERSCY